MERKDEGSVGTPRWVKISAVIALLLVAFVVVLVLTGRTGGHGPGRHAPGGLPSRPTGETPAVADRL